MVCAYAGNPGQAFLPSGCVTVLADTFRMHVACLLFLLAHTFMPAASLAGMMTAFRCSWGCSSLVNSATSNSNKCNCNRKLILPLTLRIGPLSNYVEPNFEGKIRIRGVFMGLIHVPQEVCVLLQCSALRALSIHRCRRDVEDSAASRSVDSTFRETIVECSLSKR